MSEAPNDHDVHDLDLPSDSVQEIVSATTLTLNSEPVAPPMDSWIDPATEAAFSSAIEPSIDLTLHESRAAKLSDSSPATDSACARAH